MSEKTPRLNAYVHVRDEAGQSHVFGPDSDVPDWAVAAISNPDVWAVAPSDPEPVKAATPRATRKPGPKKAGNE